MVMRNTRIRLNLDLYTHNPRIPQESQRRHIQVFPKTRTPKVRDAPSPPPTTWSYSPGVVEVNAPVAQREKPASYSLLRFNDSSLYLSLLYPWDFSSPETWFFVGPTRWEQPYANI